MVKAHDKRLQLASRYGGNSPSLDPLIKRKLSTDLMVIFNKENDYTGSLKSIRDNATIKS